MLSPSPTRQHKSKSIIWNNSRQETTRASASNVAARNIFDVRTHEIAASMSPDPGRFRGEIERRTRAVRCGEARRKRSEGKFTLAATLRECTPGRSRAAAATDPPTPTGDEKGRENERAGESLRGITVVAIENEREEGQRRAAGSAGC